MHHRACETWDIRWQIQQAAMPVEPRSQENHCLYFVPWTVPKASWQESLLRPYSDMSDLFTTAEISTPARQWLRESTIHNSRVLPLREPIEPYPQDAGRRKWFLQTAPQRMADLHKSTSPFNDAEADVESYHLR